MGSIKQAQLLELTPSGELRFEGPFDNVVTSFLQLYNPTPNRICFKVKTTAPRRYCVRPNSGIVDPMNKVNIAIMLQPFENNDSQNDRNKHKFMVQSVVIGNEQGDINQDNLWKSITADNIMDSKLKCVFHIPSNTTIATTTTTTLPQTTTTTTNVNNKDYNTNSSSSITSTEAPLLSQSNNTDAPLVSLASSEKASSNKVDLQSPKQQQTPNKLFSQQSTATVSTSSQQQPLNESPKLSFDTQQQQQQTYNTARASHQSAFVSTSTASSQANESAAYVPSSMVFVLAFVILIIGIILGKYII